MRITYITAGAGGMYCGSCIRDNALAAALMEQGHDVLLLPMYTPTRTDEKNVSAERVFFGGVSVYLEQYLSLFRHTPWLLDRLWDAPWLLRTVSGRGVQTQPEQLGELTVSVLAGRHGHQAKEIDKLVHWLKGQPTPDLIDLSNSMLIALARPIKETLGVPVCCTLQGEDVFLDHLSDPYRTRALQLIKDSVAYVDRFIAVSDYYAAHMCGYLGIPGAKVDVVPLGINQSGYRTVTGDAGSHTATLQGFTIGHFGRIAPEKGTHLLCEAFRRFRAGGQHDTASVRLAGYLAPEHRQYLESLLEQIRGWGLEDQVSYEGTLDRLEKIDFLHGLDVFAIPAAYDDPKGLALLEAMASGVPVVAPRRGTYTEMIERTGGGVLVPADDLDAFVEALRGLAADPARRRAIGARGAAGVEKHYTSSLMATRALDVYERLASAATCVA